LPLRDEWQTGGIQISYASIRFKHVILKGHEPQILIGGVPNQPQLENIMARRASDCRTQGSKTVDVDVAVCVDEKQYCSFGIPNSYISSRGDSRMILPEEC
jgi:hypothetical protein